jgi:hypothetical protein
MIQINLPAKGRVVTIRLGMGKLDFTAQRRAEIRIVLQRFVTLLGAPKLDTREHSIALWIAWKR